MFRKILVPVDLTEKNRRAVDMAGELASPVDGTVTLLHVIEPLDLPFEELQDFYERLESRAAERMAELAVRLRESGLEIDQHVVYGERAREIVEYAREEAFDLVVMSSRRVDPESDRNQLGTISHKVAILAQTPLLLVK